MLEKVIEVLSELGLKGRGILAVSGGPDSVAMLDAISCLAEEFSLDPIVAHYNHKQRPESDEDEAFVRDLAERYGLEFYSASFDGTFPSGLGKEAVLRKARYEFLFGLAKSLNAGWLAVAHNLDDQAETVLLNIIRGCGLQGLRAMRVLREERGVRVIRPLLRVTRREIEEYLKGRGIPWREDPTNRSLDFTRNKVRHILMPLIEKEFNPKVKQRLADLAEVVQEDFAFISEVVRRICSGGIVFSSDTEIVFSRTLVESLHEALRRGVFRELIRRLRGDLRQIDFRHYKEFVKMMRSWPDGSVLDLPLGVSVEKKARLYRFFLREG